jgi:4-amino-4-deoxy-L-arabinose transferase-like glycosyltransferase
MLKRLDLGASQIPAASRPADLWDGLRQRLAAITPYLQALSIYLGSRLLVALAVSFGKIYIPLGNDSWSAGPAWYHRLLRWDSEWYSLIATQGYAFNGDAGERQTVVFYPLYPLLARAVAAVTGLQIADALLVVANLAALAAILLLFRLVREQFDDRTALATVALISFFPGSIFLSAGYTEPLALLLMVGFFLALRRQRFVAAAVLAGLAAATRSSGIVLLPVLLWELWRLQTPRQFALRALPLAIIASSGLWLYVLYLGVAFGHPLAFAEVQSAFHEHTSMAARFIAAVTLQPFWRMNLSDPSPAGLDQWLVLIALALIARAWFRLGTAMTLFAALVLLLPYLSLSGGPAGFTSMARFNLVSFPLFIVAAELGQRLRWLMPAVIGLSGGLLLLYAALFSQWQWAG